MIVCIAGMHRSGTSLVARWFDRSGVSLGEKLLGPAKGNIHGHFEDVDFLELHQQFLAKAGVSFLTPTDFAYEPDAADHAAARALVAKRRHLAFWGWKEPRTTLFLPFWRQVIPEARFLLLYRHPLLVLDSLLRRGTDIEVLVRPTRGLAAWAVYNRRVLQFVQTAPAETLLCDIDRIVGEPEAFARLVHERLGVRLCPIGDVYDATQFKRYDLPAAIDERFWQAWPELAGIQRELAARADLAGPAPSAVATPSADTDDLKLWALLNEAWPGLHPTAMDAVADSWRSLKQWTDELQKGKDWLEQEWRSVAGLLNDLRRRWWWRLFVRR